MTVAAASARVVMTFLSAHHGSASADEQAFVTIASSTPGSVTRPSSSLETADAESGAVLTTKGRTVLALVAALGGLNCAAAAGAENPGAGVAAYPAFATV